MALIASLNTAVSGLKAQQFRIEVIGNNIANVDTTGYKSTRVDFSTLLSHSVTFGVAPEGYLGGIDPVQEGLGTRVASTTSDFGQGPTEATGVNTDVAIMGDGFFIMNDSTGQPAYTRNGSFTINPANLLHDPATGYVIQGWLADDSFNVTPGGPLENVELGVGVQTIARPTTVATFGGNLNSSGEIANSGTLQLSDIMYDKSVSDSSLISSENPLGFARATKSTSLNNLVRSLGDYVSHTDSTTGTAGTAALVFPELASQLTGVEIHLSALKGEREVPDRTFVVGDPPPTGGTTLGDFMNFMKGALGVNSGTWNGIEQGEHMLSYARTNAVTGEEVNGTLSLGVGGGADDSASLGSLVDYQADFTGVMPGDLIRFTSGAASGQIAEIVAVSSSVADGTPDTLTLRTDGFNSLTIVPATGDTYAINAPAGVTLADDVDLETFDATAATVSVGTPATTGSVRAFTVQDTAVSSMILEHGVKTGELVRYQSGGVDVTGTISAVNGDTFTVSFPSGLTQDPDAASTFTVVDRANGTIEVAGNAGTSNSLKMLDLTSAGARVGLFDNPPVVDAAGESATMNVTVYDSLGTPRQIELTFVFEGSSANGPNTWRYFAESPDDTDLDRIGGTGTIVFDDNGQYLTTGKLSEVVSVDFDSTPEVGGGVETPFTFELDLSRLTQFATTLSELQMRDQDGFEAGVLRDFSIDADGTVVGVFDNGLTRKLAQIPVARFANPNGLEELADSMYGASSNSGVPQVGVAGTFGRGFLRSGVLEESNVDLASQFTDLIIGQRAFQANARTITVSDEMLQELVNLI